MDFFLKGGFALYLLSIISIIAVAIIAERSWLIFFKLRLNADYFLAYIMKLIDADNFSKAISLCDSVASHPLGAAAKAALLKANRSDKEIERSIQASSAKSIPFVAARTGYLSLLANLAALTGLLGTILGLIDAFKSIAASDPAGRAELMVSGVSKAMGSTAMGLIVAIFCLLFFSVLRNAEARIIDSVEHGGMTILNHLALRNAKGSKK